MDLKVTSGHGHVTPADGDTVTTMQVPTEAAHTPRMDQVLSTHRTASGTSRYVRCSCGGFVVLIAERNGAWRQVSHAAAAGDRRA